MDHDERVFLAEHVSDKMVKIHGNDVILSGVYGSTARGEDVEWSDIDMFFLVSNESSIKGKDFLHKGIVIGIRVLKLEELERILTLPTVDWPLWMGILQILKVIYGKREIVENLIEKGLNVPQEKIRELLEDVLPSFVFESYGRILSCKIRNDPTNLGVSIVEVMLEMSKMLCLLNQKWVTHDYYEGIVETFAFPKQPKRYQDIASELWNCHDMNKSIALAEELVNNYQELLYQNGFSLDKFNDFMV
jgi:predicted nucleotidyltransferase